MLDGRKKDGLLRHSVRGVPSCMRWQNVGFILSNLQVRFCIGRHAHGRLLLEAVLVSNCLPFF